MKRSLGARTLLYPTPVVVVGTYDASGRANVMTAAWAGICCSRPPSVAVSLRRATYSHGNIVARKAFTLNVPSQQHVREVDFFGIATGRTTDKLAVAGFTVTRSAVVDAPIVEQMPLVLECRLAHTFELGLHTQFVGEIMDVKADETVLGDDGLPDPLRVSPIIYAPESRGYYGLGSYLARAFSAGKPLRPPDEPE